MVYLPRHDKHTRKKSYKSYFFFFFLLLLTGVGYYYRSGILGLFFGSETKRLMRISAKIQEEFSRNGAEIKTIDEYLSISRDYLKNHPQDASANHLYAVGHYYKIRFVGMFMPGKILEIAYAEGVTDLVSRSPELHLPLDEMYRFSLAARAISNDSGMLNNEILILSGEVFRGIKRNESILAEFKKLKEPDPELRLLYYWTGLVLSVLTGDIAYFEQLLKNPSFPLVFKENELNFLKGYLYYSGKDYLRALNFLRMKTSQENPDIQFYSSLIESVIFFKQNLPGKALLILEELYKVNPGKQTVIRKKFMEMKMLMPSLESSVIIPAS